MSVYFFFYFFFTHIMYLDKTPFYYTIQIYYQEYIYFKQHSNSYCVTFQNHLKETFYEDKKKIKMISVNFHDITS